MRRSTLRYAAALAVAALTVGFQTSVAARQAGRGSRVAQSPGADQQRADDTRGELRRVMEAYSPALGRVLKLDPTLMTNAAYLAPYPTLVAFLEVHPEIARDPTYFLSFVEDAPSAQPVNPEIQSRWEAMRMWRDLFFSGLVFTGFVAAVLSLGWLIRYAVGHRRWLRTVKLQSDVHGRLMERFTSNDELMTYIQSPAGRQFLQGLPAAPEIAGTPVLAAPISRILWSVQAGLVLGSAGVGLLVIRQYLIEEIAEILLVFGVLGVSVGVGFALAAAASYMLSHRLGLFDAAANGGSKGA